MLFLKIVTGDVGLFTFLSLRSIAHTFALYGAEILWDGLANQMGTNSGRHLDLKTPSKK